MAPSFRWSELRNKKIRNLRPWREAISQKLGILAPSGGHKENSFTGQARVSGGPWKLSATIEVPRMGSGFGDVNCKQLLVLLVEGTVMRRLASTIV